MTERREENTTRWVAVADRLPDDGQLVVLFAEGMYSLSRYGPRDPQKLFATPLSLWRWTKRDSSWMAEPVDATHWFPVMEKS